MTKPKAARRTRKRGNGEGTVWKDGDSYRWQYTLDYRRDGRRIQVGGTEDDSATAHAQLAQAIADHVRGLLALPDKITVGQYAERWLSRRHDVTPRTVHKYRMELDYALEHIGRMRVQEVRTPHLKDVVGKIVARPMRGGKPIAPQTLSRVLTRLRALFEEAVADQLVNRNPMTGVKKPRLEVNRRAKIRALDFDQEARLLTVGRALHAAGLCRLWPLVSLMLRTGLRRGEAVGLKWDAIDFEAGTIRIVRARVMDVRGIVTSGTKTTSSDRTLPVPSEVLDILRTQRDEQAQERRRLGALFTDHGIVFATATGDWTHPDNVNRALDTIVEWSDPARAHQELPWIRVPVEHRLMLMAAVRAGPRLPHISSHDLRHTYATLALRSGTDATVVSKALGHKSVAITLSIYRHVSDDEVRKAIKNTFREAPPLPELPSRVLN